MVVAPSSGLRLVRFKFLLSAMLVRSGLRNFSRQACPESCRRDTTLAKKERFDFFELRVFAPLREGFPVLIPKSHEFLRNTAHEHEDVRHSLLSAAPSVQSHWPPLVRRWCP